MRPNTWIRIAARAGWACAAIAPGILLLLFLQQPVPDAASIGILFLFALSAVWPFEGLLVYAALGPLASILGVLAGINVDGYRPFEAMTLAFLTGWPVSRALRDRPFTTPPVILISTIGLIAAALVSVCTASARAIAEAVPVVTFAHVPTVVFTDYPVYWKQVQPALLFAQGAALVLAASELTGSDRDRGERLLRMFVAGAAAAAAFNVLRIVTAALARDAPVAAFVEYMTSLRVNVHHGDPNAAGSYFAMALFCCAALRRERIVAAITAVLIGAGLWLTGSRAAFAATFVVLGAGALVAVRRSGHPRATRVAAAAAIGAFALVLWAAYPSGRNVEASRALQIRVGLAKAALAMTADAPWFGVGVGRFFEISDRYNKTPGYERRENAHNNFLQILAETGVIGFGLFALVTALALIACAMDTGSPWRLPLVAGLAAYLITCLGGHPLLVPHASYPFWMALGLAASAPAIAPATSRPLMLATAVAAGAFAVSAPFRTAAAITTADRAGASAGFSRWQREPDGVRYRWAGTRATFFVPGNVPWARIPLRLGTTREQATEVRILLEGREVDRVVLADDRWRYARLLLTGNRQPWVRVDLEAVAPGGVRITAGFNDFEGLIRVGRVEIPE